MADAFEVEETERFTAWLSGLRDPRGRQAIAARVRRFRRGLFGDVKGVGRGVQEARVDVGPGYRVYYVRRGERVILLLCGGDKRSQPRDIILACEMAAELDR